MPNCLPQPPQTIPVATLLSAMWQPNDERRIRSSLFVVHLTTDFGDMATGGNRTTNDEFVRCYKQQERRTTTKHTHDNESGGERPTPPSLPSPTTTHGERPLHDNHTTTIHTTSIRGDDAPPMDDENPPTTNDERPRNITIPHP
ncbi:hypothetical protein K443DRAFT_5357 [Laccaria amethystina LaAM-08-1]|uniref:Uncharacterized protein n=1 Tax=Laccaria amethystina LaAM-08-1 TaxID=1095629 RepID=A0A0C9XFB0_9AGAR|nr:hypothetical protein K443DRAFT_5357 [Laccaria amethystina LaAM-08-1]